MDAQVTIGLKEFDSMRDEIKNLKQEIAAFCRALKAVHNTDREDLCRHASEIEDSRSRTALLNAVHRGEL